MRFSPDLWRARALRYPLIYLLLSSVLVALRYQTRQIYPELRGLRAERTLLQGRRDELSLTVQGLTGEQRVRAWALANGMRPYAQAPKTTQPLLALPAPPRLPAPTFEVRTQWSRP